ncbi:hypothetical protein [Peribacillus frigoritolerans]|uniref:hypothetical protein n=1 Tax=Peribacillus frigoritolerans TaxID=450367 RepID=UPI0023DAF93F|nr:hypothetical protein [Peribacillus frigoritolerans]MDF1996384.1 hypothetical protein [Peribacillus frigoritolerans]
MNLQLGKKVTAQEISEANPDAIICATGSRPYTPAIEGIDDPRIIMSDDLFSSTKRPHTSEEATHEGMTREVYEEKKHPLWWGVSFC